ncbi:MAG TPA: alpha/beta fold hydrolase [Polyangiaceae bacterium]|nr:alpha/beta fold hydrolase [Polyangiaceae bacterium]
MLLALLVGSLGCGDDGGASAERRIEPEGAGRAPAPATEAPSGDEPAEAASPGEDAPSSNEGSSNEASLGESTPLGAALAPAGEPSGAVAPPDETAPASEPRLGEDVSDGWPVPALAWAPCNNGFECAEALVPRDYADPLGPPYRVAVTRRPAQNAAQRVGALFFNFGGPGSSAVNALRGAANGPFARLNERFDLVAFDPRGTGASEGPIDCRVNQETAGLYSQPFFTPDNLDVEAWTARAERYVEACVDGDAGAIAVAATANVARDMELLRRALGDEPLSYLGFSYGTFLGATYAALFPHRYRALVLDGAVDPDVYINHPTQGLREQASGFESSLQRFFDACAADPVACRGFGGDDPLLAFDELVAQATLSPLSVPGNPRPLDGDDILFTTGLMLYSKGSWNTLAAALAALADGNPAPLRQLTDGAYGRNPDGSYDPSSDAYFVLGAAEQVYETDPEPFRASGEAAFAELDHFFFDLGYTELPYGLFPIRSTGVFHGPFAASADAPAILVVGNTFDPATPYSGAQAMVEQLGNARLLTMQGDGHTAYGGDSSCIDARVDAYLIDGTLPEAGAECEQELTFGTPRNAAFVDATALTNVRDLTPPVPRAPRSILYRGRWLEL